MAKSMSGQLPMFDLMICEGSPSAISSRGSADGPTPCDSPDGRIIDLSGPEAVPVNRGAQRGEALVPVIPAIFGLRGSSSSKSRDLAWRLESRLRARMAERGSIVYSLTWKAQTTPSGRAIFQLQASARSTNGSDYGLWPTPRANERGNYQYDQANHNKPRLMLQGTATLAPWRSPDANRRGGAYQTPEKALARTQGGHQTNLEDQVALVGSPRATPKARDYKGNGVSRARRTATNVGDSLDYQVTHGLMLSGSLVSTGRRGQLNPSHSRWLMGYPVEWLLVCPENRPPTIQRPRTGTTGQGRLRASAMPSSPKSRRRSSKPTAKPEAEP